MSFNENLVLKKKKKNNDSNSYVNLSHHAAYWCTNIKGKIQINGTKIYKALTWFHLSYLHLPMRESDFIVLQKNIINKNKCNY